MSAPTVRRRRLGSELRRLRESASLRLEDVEDKTGFTYSKLSRVERALVAVKAADVEQLLNLYGITDEGRRGVLMALARDGNTRGWWRPYRDAISDAYADLISLEDEAKSVRAYEVALIPGLLQTAAYSRATIEAINMTATADLVDTLVQVRQARQSVLSKREPLEFWAIIHEASLRPRIPVGPHVMRDQLQRLLDTQDLPHVSIQILPYEATPHPGMAGPFTVLGFPDSSDLDVVLVESLTSALYVEDAAEVSIYGSAFEHLRAASLPFDESADLIHKTKELLK